MSKTPHELALIIPHPRFGAKAQADVLNRANIARHYNVTKLAAGDGATARGWWKWVLYVASRGPTVVHVARGHLIADPKALRGKGGRYASFVQRLDALDALGGVLHDVDKGWLSSRRADKSAMLARYVIDLRMASREPTGRPPGPVPVAEKLTQAQREAAEAEWRSIRHKSNADAVAAMHKRGVKIDAHTAWKLFGGSGRKRPVKKSK